MPMEVHLGEMIIFFSYWVLDLDFSFHCMHAHLPYIDLHMSKCVETPAVACTNARVGVRLQHMHQG